MASIFCAWRSCPLQLHAAVFGRHAGGDVAHGVQHGWPRYVIGVPCTSACSTEPSLRVALISKRNSLPASASWWSARSRLRTAGSPRVSA